MPLDVGFLDHGGQRLSARRRGSRKPGSSCHAAASGCAARPYRAGLPVRGRGSRCAGCAAPRCARRARRPQQGFALQLHQALRGKADHLAQECRVGALLQKRTKGDLVVGHRGDPRVRVACCTQPLLRIAAVAANRPACARPLGGRSGGPVSGLLHHHQGHDRERPRRVEGTHPHALARAADHRSHSRASAASAGSTRVGWIPVLLGRALTAG